jgi:hypothetical protein
MLRSLGAALVAANLATSAWAQQPQQRPAADTAARAGQDFARLTRDATRSSGFFDFYQKPGVLYLALPRERLGQEFLVNFQIAQGIGASGLFGGTMLSIFESKLVAFERHGERVYLVQRPHRYRARDAATDAAVRLSFGSSVLESARVEATREDSTLLINVHDWFVSDLSDVGARVRNAVSPRPGTPGRATVDRNRSYLQSVRNFPRNTIIRALVTFAPGEPVNLQTVPDSRYLPIGVSYNLAALPEQPMTPRAGDDRMGYFLTVHKDFSSDSATFFARYINRWRLECAGPPTAGLCDPRQPITYYIDRTVPVELRPWMAAGVTAWNKAFERAGFRNAVRALPLPDSADADDIRYATLRWNTSDIPGYGAIGPSTVDPRTGEILDADMLFEANMVLGWRNQWRTLVDPATIANQVMGNWSDADLAAAAAGFELSSFAESFAAGGTLLRLALLERGEIGPGDPVPMAYIGEALKWVTMHEVGHTLGLRHNFRSSSDTPLDSLASRSWAETNGLYSSVMEYPVPNIQPRGRSNGYFYNPTVGSSDEWVISYGYTPDPARAAQLAREGARPGRAYGTDEDAGGPGALDPSITPNDMSSDPLAWAQQRAALIAGLMRRLPEAVLTDNSSRASLTAAFQTLLGQYAGAAAVAVKYVGGQYQYRDHVGDPGARGPFVPVPVARQREALSFLSSALFGADAFAFPPQLLQQLGPNRWSHWGTTNTISGRIDYPLLDQALAVQTAVLGNLLHPVRMQRIRDAELRFGAGAFVPVPELMTELSRAIWSEAWSAPGRSVPAQRRDLQRVLLDRLVDLTARAPAGTPADARAAARAQLTDLDRRLAARLAARAGLDAITVAHYAESRARIARTMEAGLEVER